jgi:hypothetical protein
MPVRKLLFPAIPDIPMSWSEGQELMEFKNVSLVRAEDEIG